jgi:hypothetical protein
MLLRLFIGTEFSAFHVFDQKCCNFPETTDKETSQLGGCLDHQAEDHV